ncbi:class D sortase [Mesobacillus boroniphilus]|uniref:Class D sortase n=1 Tax=Mesobacillus boroniphilus TaxID=308892 RepID=A0A944CMR6_9BACI|nr:class D sortase [Mesobacillus boroniphilus]MBS8266038.1 class D sortase [Mesobacillus boroniphilus]
MKKVLSLLMILAGLSIFFYPAAKDYYTAYNQEKMIETWEDSSQGEQIAAESLRELEEVLSIKTKAETSMNEVPQTEKQESEQKAAAKTETKKKMSNGIVGVIEIDKIGVKLPILNGASDANLDIGAGLLEGTPAPGMPGNSAIAAHRNRAYGSMFNRLDEVNEGDTVTVSDKNNTYQYEVYETLVVEPHDTSVLNGSRDEKVLTLITCTPIDMATHRLIVKAKIKP